MTDIQVGQAVTWRARPNTIGIANCKVLDTGETPTRDPAVKMQLPPGFTYDGCPDGIVWALAKEVHPQD